MRDEMLERLRKIFKEKDPEVERTRFYEFGGWRQSRRKREFVDAAKKLAEERGIPGYQRDRDIGVPLGSKYLPPCYISGTDTLCEMDDLHQINNAAIQQMGDDIKRTAISGLDLPHSIISRKMGISVTPESINRYMEALNHSIVGGALAQESLAEINPNMTKDGYAKIMTGNEELMDEIDKRFLIDIDDMYPEEKAEKLKKKIGNHIFQVLRIPTIAVRIADGGIVHRWAGNQSALAFITTYGLGGGSILAEFSFTIKHMQRIMLGTPTWPRRGPRCANEPIGIPYGYIGDFCQADAISSDVVNYCLESMALSSALYGLIWFNSYILGSIGGVSTFASVFTNDVLDDFTYHIAEWVKKKYGGFASAKPSFDVIKEIAHEASFYVMEQYDKYPILLELNWGGAMRVLLTNSVSAIGGGLATGNSLAALMCMNYSAAYVMKEAWGRHNAGQGEGPDHINIANSVSLRADEGVMPELRSPNIFSDSLSVSNFVPSSAASFSAHSARGDAWCLSPIVKVAFSDPSLSFDFRRVRKEIARGAMREFIPEGDRDAIKPPG